MFKKVIVNNPLAAALPGDALLARKHAAGIVGVSSLWKLVPFFVLAVGVVGIFVVWHVGKGALGPLLPVWLVIAGVIFVILFAVLFRLTFSHVTVLRVARSLQFENEMFSLVIEGVNDGLWDWDVKNHKMYFSPRWLEMFGYKRVGMSEDPDDWFALIHPEDQPFVRQQMELHFEGRVPHFHAEHRIRTVGGEYKWIFDRGRAIVGKDKTVVRFSGSTTDISHMKEVELVLQGKTEELGALNDLIRREKVKTDALLTSIGDGMIATDKEGKVLVMNPQAEEMLGRKISASVGGSFTDLLPSEENEKEEPVPLSDRAITKTLLQGKKFGTVAYYFRANGEKFPVAVTSAPILLDADVVGAIVVFRDITHEKEVDKSKTEFVSLASHQLRTPLSAIRWYSEMLVSEKLGPLNNDQRNYLEEIYKSNRRMIDLVNALLNVSRIDLGTFAIEPEETDIIEICDSVISELFGKIEEKKQKIEKRYDPSFPKVPVDPKLMRIIFQNLLSNAVKYTPEAGTISVSVEKDKVDMLIKVTDTGYGIPKNAQDKIFTKLYRADNARVVESEGTGLGLYIVKAIAEKSDGSVWFESEENKGTTFYVRLPLSGMKEVTGTKGLA